MDQNIINLLIALIPSLVGVLSILGSAIAVIVKVRKMVDDGKDENKELQKKLTQCVNVNIELTKVNEEFKTKIEELELKIADESQIEKSKVQAIIEQNIEVFKQNEELKEFTAQLKTVKHQIAHILKKEK